MNVKILFFLGGFLLGLIFLSFIKLDLKKPQISNQKNVFNSDLSIYKLSDGTICTLDIKEIDSTIRITTKNQNEHFVKMKDGLVFVSHTLNEKGVSKIILDKDGDCYPDIQIQYASDGKMLSKNQISHKFSR